MENLFYSLKNEIEEIKKHIYAERDFMVIKDIIDINSGVYKDYKHYLDTKQSIQFAVNQEREKQLFESDGIPRVFVGPLVLSEETFEMALKYQRSKK